MKFTKKMAVINGRKTFYWEKGGTAAQTIIFLHGFPGNHLGLVDFASAFKGSYRVAIPDLPACGQSEPLAQAHTLKNYAKWLDSFLESLGVRDAIIIGHSFGARTALTCGIYYPERIKKLVLITPVLKVDGLIAVIASYKGKIAKLLPKNLQKPWLSNALYQKAVHVIVFKSASPARKKEIVKMDDDEIKHLNVRATIEVFDEFYASDLITSAGQCKIPCLVVAGDKDEIATLTSVQELAAQLPNVSLDVMKDSGHLMPLERPLATAKVIQIWLDKVSKLVSSL